MSKTSNLPRPATSSPSWPRTFCKVWTVREMLHQERQWHVLKHMQSDEERWWQLSIPFSRSDAQRFEEEAIAHDIRVWFPRQEVGERSAQSRAAWLRGWPTSLRRELDQLYLQCYRPYTEAVMDRAESEQVDMYHNKHQGRHDATLLLDRQGVLVVLKVDSLEHKKLRWASTYRPLTSQKRTSTSKKWRKLVRSLREASLY